MFIFIVIHSILIAWLVGKIIASWAMRKIIMQRLAKKMHLQFIMEKGEEVHYKLRGSYLGKNVIIDEKKSLLLTNKKYSLSDESEIVKDILFMIPFVKARYSFSKQMAKKTIISVNDKIVYNRVEDLLLLSAKKIVKVINQYIENGYISKNNFKKPLTIFGFYFVDFMILLFVLAIFVALVIVRNYSMN